MAVPTLRQLQTFIAAVEAGSITQAARALHLTQPAASQQLRQLERILGVRLLDRTTRSAEPTEISTRGRHDPCLLPRFVPMGEAMVALVLIDHWLRFKAQCR